MHTFAFLHFLRIGKMHFFCILNIFSKTALSNDLDITSIEAVMPLIISLNIPVCTRSLHERHCTELYNIVQTYQNSDMSVQYCTDLSEF